MNEKKVKIEKLYRKKSMIYLITIGYILLKISQV